MQDYICRLANYLYQLGSNTAQDHVQEQITAQMKQQTMEVSFLIRRLMVHPKSHKAIVSGRLDDGSASKHPLDADFYQDLIVSSCHPHPNASGVHAL